MTRILGIDPGINGACSLYCSESATPTVSNGIFDIPTVGEGPQREIDYAQLRDLIFATQPDVAVIEIINAFMPTKKDAEGNVQTVQWGRTSLFRFGGSYFAIHAVVACLNIPRVRVSSAKWKNYFGLRGKAKGGGTDDAARQVALRKIPSAQPSLTRKGDQHRAESLLMAVWYSETGGGAKVAKRARQLTRAADNINKFDFDAEDIPE